MRNLFSYLFSYLASRKMLLLSFFLSSCILLIVYSLAGLPMLYGWYTLLLSVFTLVCLLFFDATRYCKKRQLLSSLSPAVEELARALPEPADGLEADYRALVLSLEEQHARTRSALIAARDESLAYYTLWIHQIKTPIAAMRLVLQKMEDDEAAVLLQELFKVEQYSDLALRYAKLTDIASDLIPEHCDLSEVVHECVKKYGLLFIYQKLTVQIAPISRTVIGDKRWLAFIVEQILSNAVKYTKTGGVKIWQEQKKLVIADTGIGIRTQDLPRIFERGYTGCNGRLDSRASGIGLYLAKKAADALGISISVASTPGKGTTVTLTFPEEENSIFE